ncbi:MAG TPA: hypothetical protein VHR66_17560 [Gemmataceae bacterium]|nr:hypothetical protein [Gemmataceae bacterium]
MAIPIPRRRVARAEALWAFIGMVVIWAGFVLLAEIKFPWWYDREYEVRHELLDERVAEHPERPILAVIGSSRIGTAFCPSELPPIYDAESRQVLVFNYSHHGSGPRLNLMQMHRLIRAGHEPTWLVIEIVPAHLRYEAISSTLASAADIPVLMPYENKPKLLIEFSRLRLNIVYKNRTAFLRTFAPPFATKAGEGDDIFLGPLGDDAILSRPGAHPETKKQQQFELIKGMYANQMQNFDFDSQLVEATRGLLQLCRDRHILTALLIAPEDSRFRSWYGDGVEEKIQKLYHGLGDEFGVPVIDARSWCPDEDFLDPHHLMPEGAKRFTLRLGREVLGPVARGELR